MKIAVHSGGVTRTVAAMHVRVGGTTRAVARAWLRDNGALKQFFASMDSQSGGSTNSPSGITVSPTGATGFANSAGTTMARSNTVTVTVTGGVAPYTFAWTYVSGDVVTCNAPTAAATTFSATLSASESRYAEWKCRVTDAAGVVADSATVPVTLQNIGELV